MGQALDMAGPGLRDLPLPAGFTEEAQNWQGRIFSSSDGGARWEPCAAFPFVHAARFSPVTPSTFWDIQAILR
jgi:hypothetical protein